MAISRSDELQRYYNARAVEYDDWCLGRGTFAEQERPGWNDELARLIALVASLSPARTLDVACGTGFLTRHLQGHVVALDASAAMLSAAARQSPNATFVRGDGLTLPFPDRSFDRVFTSHFYGHVDDDDRKRFLREARRVASQLVVVDAAWREGVDEEESQERVLNNGSRWCVYKCYFRAEALAGEVGGEVVLAGRWFVGARAREA